MGPCIVYVSCSGRLDLLLLTVVHRSGATAFFFFFFDLLFEIVAIAQES